jgi:hypothetical protein
LERKQLEIRLEERSARQDMKNLNFFEWTDLKYNLHSTKCTPLRSNAFWQLLLQPNQDREHSCVLIKFVSDPLRLSHFSPLILYPLNNYSFPNTIDGLGYSSISYKQNFSVWTLYSLTQHSNGKIPPGLSAEE